MFQTLRRRTPRTNRRFRTNAFETLEQRELLSSTPPTVVSVEVASTAWSESFFDYLNPPQSETYGYTIPVGTNAQSASLTWTNLDQIVITFSEDVNVDAADLSMSGVNTSSYAFSDFHYDPIRHAATWTLGASLGKDRLRLDLDANGMDPVCDLDENILDGEWTNNVNVVSGNGAAGGDFEFNFNVLPTDVNNTANITHSDYVYIRQLEGKTTTSPGYSAKRDVDGNGVINSADWQAALDRLTQSLPGGSPAGTNNDAPTTAGFNLVEISDAAVDVAISLMSHFSDAESGSSGLTYSIISNDHPELFDSVSIDPVTKQLIVNAASGASGRATIVVGAADAGGQHVYSTMTTDINRENQPPEILDFECASIAFGTWIVSGRVVDPDDDVSNVIVEFYGVFAARASVDESGFFMFAVVIDEYAYGLEHAKTHDPHGAHSNEAFATVMPT
jgi:hypothetical protein